jgi:hypothetical protein
MHQRPSRLDGVGPHLEPGDAGLHVILPRVYDDLAAV